MHVISTPRTRRAVTALVLAAATVAPLGVTTAGSAIAATRKAVMADGAANGRAHGYHIGIAVLDTRIGRLYGSGDYDGTFASESIVKVFIATRLLVSGRMHGATQRAAYKMITQSDDAIATRLWPRVGGPRLIPWIKAHYRVPNLGTR